MALAPLSTGPHVVRADRLAFTIPVREAGREGWITLHPSGDEEGEGTVHVYVGSGGYIEKGPKALCHQQIGQLASHPSVARTTRHPAGHEPAGARDHPEFHEAGPKPRAAQPAEGQEPAKRPGKPYARLSGAEQGTRQEQIGKALGEAQSAARGAAGGEAHAHLAALPDHVRNVLREAGVKVQQHKGSQAEALPQHGVSTPMAKLSPADAGYDSRTGTAHFFGGKAERYNVHHELGHALDDALGYKATGKHHTPYSSQPEFQALYRKHKENMDLPPPMRHSASEMFADAFAMHHDVLHQEGETADGEPRMVHRGRKLERAAPDVHAHIAALSKGEAGSQQSARKPEDKIADTAVAHQQAQADLAAHRASADRNPNPWAPHLSPPAGDAKDRELAEKATRAQMAHQAVVAQQQGAQQAEQQEGQRAHEKEMVRLKQAAGGRREAGEKPARPRPAHEHQEGDSGEIYKARNELQDAQRRWAMAKVEARTPAEHKRVELHQEMVRRLSNQVRDLEGKAKPPDAPKPAEPKKPAQEAYEALMGEVKRRQGGRTPEPTPRFSEPQTAPQPEQPAGVPAPKTEQTRFGQGAPAGPMQHKAATSGDPIQPARAKPVGQLGLFGEHKPLAEPKKRGSAAQQQMQGGQKSLFGSSFSNPHERTSAPDGAAETERRKSLEEAERAARSEAIATITASRKNPARVEATGRAHDAAMAALAEHDRGGTPAPAPEVHDEGHVGQIMQVHAKQDAAGRQAYQNQMARIATGESYRPTMPDGQPLGRATAAEAVRRMMRAGRHGSAR